MLVTLAAAGPTSHNALRQFLGEEVSLPKYTYRIICITNTYLYRKSMHACIWLSTSEYIAKALI